jgi:hypothetical protein
MVSWRSASGGEVLVHKTARGRVTGAVLLASPLLFGVPVVLGIAISVIRLLGTAYPELGWATTVNSDAEELYLGHTIYQNPAHGYTGTLYTPLFPTLVSFLLHIHLWNGWPLLVTIGATVSLIVLAARIAYAPNGSAPRVVRMLSTAGIGGIAYWCVASVRASLLDDGRTDQLAWAFALCGLVAVAGFGPAPSRRRVVFTALLLSAALWTKQTTFSVSLLAFVWVWGLAAVSALSRRAAWLFTAALGCVNLALLLVLNLLTDGWEFYINFEMPSRHAMFSLYGSYVTEGLRSSALAAGFVGAIWLVCGVSAATNRRRLSMRSRTRELTSRLRRLLVAQDPTGRRVLLFGLYVPLGFALAVYAMRKQGTSDNEFIGVVWVLGLLAAAGWRIAQRHAGAVAAASGCVVLYFVLVQLGPIRETAANAGVSIPGFEEAFQWSQVSPELRFWARDHTIYTPTSSDLNVPNGGPLYPNYFNFADLLAAGNQPLYLVRALLDRRFDGVEFFELHENPYTSGYGKWEENYLWKLDEVIAARYTVEPGLPQGLLGRRPGPERAAWMRYCFGPFAAGGVSFRIHHGGGFWCSFAPGRLQLVEAPTPLSEVVTTQPVRVAGTIAVSVEGQAPAHVEGQTPPQVSLVLEGGSAATWMARVAAAPGNSRDLTVTTYLGGASLGSTLVPATKLPGGRREVRLSVTPTNARPGPPLAARPGATTLTAPAAKAAFALVATNGAAVDLNAMRLGH